MVMRSATRLCATQPISSSARCAAVTSSPGFGGEEFAVLLPNTDEWGAIMVAERVRAVHRRLSAGDGGRKAGSDRQHRP